VSSSAPASGPAGDDALSQLLAQRAGSDQGIIDVDVPMLKVVIFTLGDDLFAFPGRQVREILPLQRIWFVPGCPSSVEGVIDIRGDICSVLRLAELIGIDQRADGAAPRAGGAILLGHAGGMESGLRVDLVMDVVDVIEADILTPSETLPAQLEHVVTGFFERSTGTGSHSVLLLDMGRLFDAWRAEHAANGRT